MVTVDKVQKGVSRFLDIEILPKMAGRDKWILTALATVYIAKLPEIIRKISEYPAVKILGVIDDAGNIDIDTLMTSIRPAAMQTPATFTVPMGGTITLTAADLDKLNELIKQA
jgi:hypothetical protein